MTNIPEVFLAREAQLCYATVAIVTDYDCWMEDISCHVSVNAVIALYGESLQKAQKLLLTLLDSPLPEIDDNCRKSLCEALLTPEADIPEGKRELLSVLRR